MGASVAIDFVYLYLKRNRGWPWPEDSWGLDSMFGRDGWCQSCGTPLHEQTGPLTLQARGMSPVRGAWVPNWRFDVICLEDSICDVVAKEFRVDLRRVEWRRSVQGGAMQVVAPTVGRNWFDPDELCQKAILQHGTAGETCASCGIWRWMPLAFGLTPPELPALRPDEEWDEFDVVASPEWFGAGKRSFRQVLVRRRLGELIANSSPKDFKVSSVD